MLKRFFLISTIVLVQGCSGTLNSHFQTLKYAFTDLPDQILPIDEVKSSQIELAYVKSGERPMATIAKVYDEFGKEKWVSADRAMLVVSDGYIVKTLGFTNDLEYVSNLKNNPLGLGKDISNQSWERDVDWSKGEYGYRVVSNFEVLGEEQVTITSLSFPAIKVKETVTYMSKSNRFRFDDEWENWFWIDTRSGEIIRTIQKQSPFGESFDIQFISAALQVNKGQLQ